MQSKQNTGEWKQTYAHRHMPWCIECHVFRSIGTLVSCLDICCLERKVCMRSRHGRCADKNAHGPVHTCVFRHGERTRTHAHMQTWTSTRPHASTRKHGQARTHPHASAQARKRTHTHTHTRMHTHTHARTHARTHMHTHTHTHTCAHASTTVAHVRSTQP